VRQTRRPSPGAEVESTKALARGEWPAYAGTYAAARYSPLAQINRTNAKNLHIAWRWKSPDQAIKDANPAAGPSFANESTPLMVGGTLYFAQMIALDARSGNPVPTFGKDGRVDLAQGLRRPVDRAYYTMTSPPVIVRGVIVVGSSVLDWWGMRPALPGDVRGFDVATGRLLWTFHTVAQEGEAGVETWEKESWKEAGGANVRAPMSADEELGYVYLPVSTPTNDYYGGDRPGDGLYGDSLVCLDAATGKKVWHYQLVHHGLWDYDPPAAPNLIDISSAGSRSRRSRR
jgi:glucose dehydrogenase